jgi:hypothetical protein
MFKSAYDAPYTPVFSYASISFKISNCENISISVHFSDVVLSLHVQVSSKEQINTSDAHYCVHQSHFTQDPVSGCMHLADSLFFSLYGSKIESYGNHKMLLTFIWDGPYLTALVFKYE